MVAQCFQAKNIKKTPSGFLDSMISKIKGKMGDVCPAVAEDNFRKLGIDGKQTMVIGLYVHHPKQNELCHVSISAAVGSLDPTFTQFSSSVRVQARGEMIEDLGEMIKELMEEFRKANHAYPTSLIVLRDDGPSEGTVSSVTNDEIDMLERTLHKLVPRNGKMTLILSQRQHDTRFMLSSSEPRAGGSGTRFPVPPGTVVDSGIVDPCLKMFYLNSAHFSPSVRSY